MSNNNGLMWQFQPYKSWKGGSSFNLFAGWSRPNVNKSTINQNNYIGPVRKARPLKIWRRQLQPTSGSGSSVQTVDLANRPGGSIYKSTCNCDVSGNNYMIDVSFNPAAFQNPTSTDKIQNNGFVAVGGATTDGSYNIQTGMYDTNCVACNPENNIIKSGNVQSSNAYYSDRTAYLQSRCKTYDQKLFTDKISGVTYIENNTALHPTNSSNGSQNFNTNCFSGNKSNTCEAQFIYKPNNQSFATQGAVSNGVRIAKLKNDTITRNGNSFTTAWGAQAVNSGKYQGTSDGSYFIKNWSEQCNASIYHRQGNPTATFYTPLSQMVRQMPRNNRSLIPRNPPPAPAPAPAPCSPGSQVEPNQGITFKNNGLPQWDANMVAAYQWAVNEFNASDPPAPPGNTYNLFQTNWGFKQVLNTYIYYYFVLTNTQGFNNVERAVIVRDNNCSPSSSSLILSFISELLTCATTGVTCSGSLTQKWSFDTGQAEPVFNSVNNTITWTSFGDDKYVQEV